LEITVANLPPVARATASARTINEDATVYFTGQNSTDTPSDFWSLAYYWEFGDDTEAEGMNASHVYKKAGSYTVRLRVTDTDGGFSDDTTIKIIVKNVAPTVTLAANRTTAVAGESISFGATGNDTPSDMAGLTYNWRFGDGGTASGTNATHMFATEGSYTVRVEVTDNNGEKAEASQAVQITPQKKPAPAPPSGPNIGLVAGGAVAAAVMVVVVVAVVLRRRK